MGNGQEPATDEVLWRRAQAGARAAFDALLQKYWQAMLRTAARVAGEDLANDAVQNVALKLWRKRDRIEAAKMTPGFFAVVAKRAAIDVLRRREKHVVYAEAPVEPAVRELPDAASPFDDRKSMLKRCIDRLGEEFRETVLAFFFAGRSYKEIAEKLGIAIGTVGGRIDRAKTRLKACLEGGSA